MRASSGRHVMLQWCLDEVVKVKGIACMMTAQVNLRVTLHVNRQMWETL